MSELYGKLWSSLGSFIASWTLPSTLGVGFFVFALLPRVEDRAPWSGLSDVSTAGAALWFAFATVVVSFALAVAARPFFRLLEGYTLRPQRLKDRWIKSQRQRRKNLLRRVRQESDPERVALLREQLNQFPREAAWILPTRLGNAMRAGETYGSSQYGLSTQALWTRLVTVVDDKVNAQLSQSRVVLDFFIAMMALSGGLAVATIIVAIAGGDALVLLWLLLLGGLVPLWYNRAVASVGWYAQAIHALVDLGRVPLAEKLGIHLPGDLEAERGVWEAVTDYADWGPGWDDTPRWLARINDVLVERGASGSTSKNATANTSGEAGSRCDDDH